MNKQLRHDYDRFRMEGATIVGMSALCALHDAKTLRDWRELEDAGKVRLRAEPEEESYFDVFGEPEGYTNAQGHYVTPELARQSIIEALDRDGLWWVVSEYKACLCECCEHDTWEQADSIGMCNYDDPCDPFQNCYVPELMAQAIGKVRESEDL